MFQHVRHGAIPPRGWWPAALIVVALAGCGFPPRTEIRPIDAWQVAVLPRVPLRFQQQLQKVFLQLRLDHPEHDKILAALGGEYFLPASLDLFIPLMDDVRIRELVVTDRGMQ